MHDLFRTASLWETSGNEEIPLRHLLQTAVNFLKHPDEVLLFRKHTLIRIKSFHLHKICWQNRRTKFDKIFNPILKPLTEEPQRQKVCGIAGEIASTSTIYLLTEENQKRRYRKILQHTLL